MSAIRAPGRSLAAAALLALCSAGAGRAQAPERVEPGDFRPGDLILLVVQGESTLSDTFAVGPDTTLALPSPVIGTLSLRGVRRAELQDHLARWIGQFVQRPVVRAQAMIRLSVQGEVARAGVFAVPSDGGGALSDAVMAAGGFTREANVNKVRIERDGRRIWEGKLQQALTAGRAADGVTLREGDQLVIPRRGPGVSEGLRSAWFLVSIAGGLFALSRVL